MPAYLIVYTDRRGDDTLIEDDNLALTLTDTWAIFHDSNTSSADSVALAIPTAQIARVERVDPLQEPAPQKE